MPSHLVASVILTAVCRKHGTFRPKLLALVQSNTAETILETTNEAYELIRSADGNVSPLPALKVLTQLKGIGPATASLLLSVLRMSEVPFFSDELFRWCCWDEANDAKGAGWRRGIKYNAKEYGVLVEKVSVLRKRLGVGNVMAVDVEKVAWVLGKEGVDVSAEDEKNEDAKMDRMNEEDATEDTAKHSAAAKKAGTKRKTAEVETSPKKVPKKAPKSKAKEVSPPPAASTRRSTRKKT